MNLRGNLFIEYINDEPNFWVFAVILKQVGSRWMGCFGERISLENVISILFILLGGE